MENLAIVVDSLGRANKALRAVIEKGANEVGQLKQFEDKFRDTEQKFARFKEFVVKNDKQADTLKSRLDQDVSFHRQNAESLKRQIDYLKRAIEDQSAENEKLMNDLKVDIERLHKLKHNSDRLNTYVNTKSPQLFIQRLQNDLE